MNQKTTGWGPTKPGPILLFASLGSGRGMDGERQVDALAVPTGGWGGVGLGADDALHLPGVQETGGAGIEGQQTHSVGDAAGGGEVQGHRGRRVIPGGRV